MTTKLPEPFTIEAYHLLWQDEVKTSDKLKAQLEVAVGALVGIRASCLVPREVRAFIIKKQDEIKELE